MPSRTVYDVHEGRPSWHQQRAGHISAAVTSGFTTKGAAEEYCKGLAEHHPEIHTFILERTERDFLAFAAWEDVIAHVRERGCAYYQAPLDHKPVFVHAAVHGANPRKVRVRPTSRDVDPFWADSGHLDRFRKES